MATAAARSIRRLVFQLSGCGCVNVCEDSYVNLGGGGSRDKCGECHRNCCSSCCSDFGVNCFVEFYDDGVVSCADFLVHCFGSSSVVFCIECVYFCGVSDVFCGYRYVDRCIDVCRLVVWQHRILRRCIADLYGCICCDDFGIPLSSSGSGQGRLRRLRRLAWRFPSLVKATLQTSEKASRAPMIPTTFKEASDGDCVAWRILQARRCRLKHHPSHDASTLMPKIRKIPTGPETLIPTARSTPA
jgi:hypothetical protein